MRRYGKLSAYLNEAGSDTKLRHFHFADLEDILGFPLPASARRYPAWWANDRQPSRHSNAWLSAGWETAELDLRHEQVTFRRCMLPDTAPPPETRKSDTRAAVQTNTPWVEALADAPDGAVQLALGMQWKELGPIALDAAGNLVFPGAPAALPSLYRMRLLDSIAPRHYIGETMDLRRRFQHYRTPGPSQATNRRLKELLLSHLGAQGRALVDIITSTITLTDMGTARVVDLSDKTARRFSKQAALIAESAQDVNSLNR
ncbi:DUF7662 domain-containing protein [Salinisphaera sp. RV14]|uniref:DUF7662 domain-containing protein n=1 Tax=Salinisphaera sp. RV14 TaxID=3454140 RepID=UPI003F870A1B